MASDDQLLNEVMHELRDAAQSMRRFDNGDVESIKKFRAVGRRAGRALGWKVRTFQLDRKEPSDRQVVVYVAVIESTPLHQELMRVRGEKKLRQIFDESFRNPGD